MGARNPSTLFSRNFPKFSETNNPDFWEGLIASVPAPLQIIDGGLYSFQEVNSILVRERDINHPYRYIITTDKQILKGNDVRFLGWVPEYIREKLPDTAHFINKGNRTLIEDNPNFQCNRKGCYDRYHCLWYDPAQMEPDGPWNKIPKWHTPGWEECPLFINKQNPFNFRTNH